MEEDGHYREALRKLMQDYADGSDEAGDSTIGEASANDHPIEKGVKADAQEGNHPQRMPPVHLAVLRAFRILVAGVHYNVLFQDVEGEEAQQGIENGIPIQFQGFGGGYPVEKPKAGRQRQS